MLRVADLTKSFGGLRAVAEVSFEASPGQVVGLMGPNGAGKTTLFNLVCGYLLPDTGSIKFNGVHLTDLAPFRRARMGIARSFQEVRLVAALPALAHVRLSLRYRTGDSMKGADRLARSRDLLESVGLVEEAATSAGELSYGQQKLLSFACCEATDPNLLLLDEPFAGIAPTMARIIAERISELAKRGVAILVIEHNTTQLRAVCDRLVFLDKGALVADGPPEEVLSNTAALEAYLG